MGPPPGTQHNLQPLQMSLHSTVLKVGYVVFVVWQGCQRVIEDWTRIIQVRSLVVTPHDDMRTWLKYSSLCRDSGRMASLSGLYDVLKLW